MTVNYTTNLALGQPVTGTESGTWGDDVNNSVTSYLDIAIAGGLAITITTTDVTLSITQGTSSATNIGSTTAQYAILNVSGAMTAARNLILPSSSRQYVINNNTTGGFALTVKGSATSGVTMVNGEKAHVFWNGTDYAKLSNTPGGAGTFSSITNTGLTSGRVVYSTTGGLETDSAGLTFDGTNFATTGTATAAKLIPTGSSATGNGLYLPAANSVGISTNGTNAVYIDSSQNVGIGAAPSFKLDVQQSQNASSNARIYNGNTGASAQATFVAQSDTATMNMFAASSTYTSNASISAIQVTTNTPLTIWTNNVERMRFNANGQVLVSATTAFDTTSFLTTQCNGGLATKIPGTGLTSQMSFFNDNGRVGWIGTSGTTTSYNTSSDYRLKENIQPMTGALATVQQLKPVTYKWKFDGSNGQGFIAHELQAIVPDCVSGDKDAVNDEGNPLYQGVDTSFLVATLTAAIQEQQALITSLTARIEALEAV